MSRNVTGNLHGLAVSQRRKVEKLYQRRVGRHEVVSLDLAREIYSVAAELRRRVGVLVSRDGLVEEVFIGSREMLYLPELGRFRAGPGRLRRLRLIFSDLSAEPVALLPADIKTDLEALRLDLVMAVKVSGNRTCASLAHVVPGAQAGKLPLRVDEIPELSLFDLDFAEFIGALEAELATLSREVRVSSGTQAVLVGVYDKRQRSCESSMAELEELSRTAGLSVVDRLIQKRTPDPRTLLGKGKLEELLLRCQRVGAEMIVFDSELRPSQWRSIVNSTELKVLDRSMLILDIFSQRASSSEGRLQVELAQLKYNLPRLTEMDSGLSRLTGGIGGRGPGETKLEIGRRRIRDRINDLEKRIDKISQQRGLRRAQRVEREIPLVAILGYTNVGKSTLFNALTGSKVLVENKLFATLDPAQRRLVFPPRKMQALKTDWAETAARQAQSSTAARTALETVIMSDTVGFIRHLPAELINAFRATLEELNNASLLLHVLDASDPEIKARRESVEGILAEIHLDGIQVLTVLNKIDLVKPEDLELISREHGAIPVSARGGEGLDRLIERMREAVYPV